MNKRIAHWMTYLYPRAWRDRYGAELEALLVSESSVIGATVNVAQAALKEHLFPTQPVAAQQRLASVGLIVRQPSAIAPLAMSLAALSIVLWHIAAAGIAPQADEGTAAHLWQLLIVAQAPVLLVFLIKWLPKAPKQAVCVLALQAAAVLAAIAPVFILKW